MTAASLAAWGILRADEVVAAAAAAGLPLAAAAALLEQESAGGHNVWGHDAVATGGAYVKGGPVDEPSYRAYRAALAAGRAGQQGVGPCQLTARDYQDQADALGGCWLPVPNMRVGFGLLAGYVQRWGLGPAFRAYNGGAGTVLDPARYPSPAAHAYERAAMEKYGRWVTRLGPTSTSSASSTTAAPAAEEDDMRDDERAALFEVRDALRASGIGKGRLPGRALDPRFNGADDLFGWVLTAAGRAADAAALASRPAAPTITADELAAALLRQLLAAPAATQIPTK